jgi:hypothetical protein
MARHPLALVPKSTLHPAIDSTVYLLLGHFDAPVVDSLGSLYVRVVYAPLPNFRRELIRRGWSLLLIVVYAVVSIGIPLPPVAKTASERFPCENCACGCSSAVQCWNNCCCHSLSERLAWAKREGVTPPSYLQTTQASTAGSCCSTKRSCCSQREADSGPPSCCSQAAQEPDKSDDWCVIGWRALECQGKSLGWLVAVPVVAVAADQSMWLDHVTWLGPLDSESVVHLSGQPPQPPPESLRG